jgi:hypothetical protein
MRFHWADWLRTVPPSVEIVFSSVGVTFPEISTWTLPELSVVALGMTVLKEAIAKSFLAPMAAKTKSEPTFCCAEVKLAFAAIIAAICRWTVGLISCPRVKAASRMAKLERAKQRLP